ISTYVHFDALYQAYLNACLIMLASQTSPQPGLPHQDKSATRTKGFAQFGGPHILTLVTEVATRALKAVRYQKFTQHRRGRPEQLAGLISQYKKFETATHNPFDEMKPLVDNLDKVMFGRKSLLDAVFELNKKQGHFLPMAFPEGSPMHPSYGAGHATVAGACVTALKAFFVTSDPRPPRRRV
ncbi:MAG: bromoperoxidase, partial [Myxococcota bacterium]